MKMLAFGLKFVEWDAVQAMSFTLIELCLKQAAEWSDYADHEKAKAARRR